MNDLRVTTPAEASNFPTGQLRVTAPAATSNGSEQRLRVTPGELRVSNGERDVHPEGEAGAEESTSCQFKGKLVDLPQDGPKLIVPEQYQLELVE